MAIHEQFGACFGGFIILASKIHTTVMTPSLPIRYARYGDITSEGLLLASSFKGLTKRPGRT